MNLATKYPIIYSTHLSDGHELYVTDRTLEIISEETGHIFYIELDDLICVHSFADYVKISYMRKKYIDNSFLKYKVNLYEWEINARRFSIHSKTISSNSSNKQLLVTETKKLAKIILDTVYAYRGVNNNNVHESMALHADEYMVGCYEAQSQSTSGKLVITNNYISFVSKQGGLVFRTRLDKCSSYHLKKDTIKINYVHLKWNAKTNKMFLNEDRYAIFKLFGSAKNACVAIKEALNSDNLSESDIIIKYEKFSKLSTGEIFAEYFKGKFGERKNLYRYINELAVKRWGKPPHDEIQGFDHNVIAACMLAGLPFSVTGTLTARDNKIRTHLWAHQEKYEKFRGKINPLIDDYNRLISRNFSKEASEDVKKYDPRLINDVLIEIAKNGTISTTFVSETKKQMMHMVGELAKLIKSKSSSELTRVYHYDVPCLWSQNEAKKILKDMDYKRTMKYLTRTWTEFDPKLNAIVDLNPWVEGILFYYELQKEMYVRIRRVYDEWCKTHSLTDHSDPYDKNWVQYLIDHADHEKLKLRKQHYDHENTPIERLISAWKRSSSTKTRLKNFAKPDGIPDESVYVDAWYDANQHYWFTTNPYLSIEQANTHKMNMEVCTQKFGFSATVFAEDVVEMMHDYPAIYDKKNDWWILLSTIDDKDITKTMAKEKDDNNLKYETVQPNASLRYDGLIRGATEMERFLDVHLIHIPQLRLNERMRRFLFLNTTGNDVDELPQDYAKSQGSPLDDNIQEHA